MATTDECGTCDADSSNDCVQDCAGEWGGSAEEDNCGTCDADSSNDCTQDCAGEWGGSAEDLGCGCNEAAPSGCDETCGSTAVVDDCGVCGGDGSSCLASLSLGAFDASGSLEILYDFGSDVAGFQFDVSGLAIDGASGGAAGEAGFTVSVGSTTVLGVSFTGGTVPAGSGVLTTLSFSAVTGDSTELSLGNSGAVSTAAGDTLELSLSGSIAHTQDCAGTYYGDAVADNCGACDSDSTNDCTEDCNGDWGGMALLEALS